MSGSRKIELYCVAVGSKLRVRVATEGYLRNTNCQFPRNLRKDGVRFEIDEQDMKLIVTRGKYYYTVKNKGNIRIIEERTLNEVVNIYTDDTQEDCIVCMEKPKSIVFSPCGHFYSCDICCSLMKQCPICRGEINGCINKSEFGSDD